MDTMITYELIKKNLKAPLLILTAAQFTCTYTLNILGLIRSQLSCGPFHH